MTADPAPRVPSIYDFPDFASFLRSSLEALRPEGHRYSLRNLARRAGRSPSLLAMVARGERRVQPELAGEICSLLGLTPVEVTFAEALVEFERARTVSAKTRAAEQLRALRPRQGDLILELDTFTLISSWHHSVIIELACTEAFQENAAWICRQLGGSVTPAMVEDSLALLVRLGLLMRNADGRLVKSTPTIATQKNKGSAVIRSFHKQVLMRAHRAVERQKPGERFVTTATIAVPAAIIPEINKRMVAFRDELLAFVRDHHEAGDTVYHMGMQFFRAIEPAPKIDT